MTERPGWLPPLVLFETYAGNWECYLDALYAFFKTDFVETVPLFRRARLALKRHPIIKGKEATFWHLISTGSGEDDRLPDLRRCERIRWPRPIIEHADETIIRVWENERKGERRICLWLENQEYLVILARRRGYVLLWTGYPVTEAHQKAKLRKEFEARKKADAAR